MHKSLWVSALAIVLASVGSTGAAAGQATDDIRSPQPPAGNPGAGAAGPIWRGPQALLLDSGPLVTHPGGGPAGADASRVQNSSFAMITLGFTASTAGPLRVTDDFTVPAAGWGVSTITFFAYQTGATACTLTDVRVQIWDGPPNAGGTIVFGDTTTNRLASCALSNIYRDTETTVANDQRPIQAATATVATNLAAGTYWVDYQLGGTLASGPFVPPITILGQTTTGNGLQWNGTAWANLTDTGSATQQGLRFVIDGAVLPVELQKFSID